MLLILGKTNDDKGTQLEQIARTMLSSKGYQSIKLNPVGAGGAEYDVVAEYVMPLAVGTRIVKVIGECKARKDQVNMTDWQKFMGKIFLEEVKSKYPVTGLFIAATGFNSYVASSYEELCQHRDNLTLVGEQDIEEFLRQQYAVCSVQQVANSAAMFTSRTTTTVELCYYDTTCYWLMAFEKGVYSLFDAGGKPLQGDSLPQLQTLIKAATSLHAFVDLDEEAEARRRGVAAQKHVLARLMLYAGHVDEPTLVEDSESTPEEIGAAVVALSGRKWLESSDDVVHLASTNSEGECGIMVDILRFWLQGEMSFKTLLVGLSSAFYDRHVNENLLNDVLQTQGDLQLPAEQYGDIIRIFELSPTALLRALTPIQMITQHRINQACTTDDRVNEYDRNLFHEHLIDALVLDFRQPELAQHFCGIRGILEVEQSRGVVVKNADGIDTKLKTCSRLTIRPSNVSSGFIHLGALSSQPEPWEMSESERRIDLAFDLFKQ